MTAHRRPVTAVCGLIAFTFAMVAPAAPAAALNNVPFSGQYYTENVEYWDAARGETKQFVVGYTNLGQKPWVKGSPGNEARLGTRDPLENAILSSGGWAVNWTSPTRIAIQDDAAVAPGAVGYFIYSAKVPSGAPAGRHQIKARPLIEGVLWLEDYGYYQGFNVAAQAGSGATFTCGTSGLDNSCTPSGMQTLINNAAHGDTINIAAGVHAWSGAGIGVLVSKRLTIQGGGAYGVDANHNDTGAWPARLNTGTATAFKITAPPGAENPRITGIHFSGNPPFTYNFGDANAGLFINMSAGVAFYRIDNNKFASTAGQCGIYANSPGLIDHNYFATAILEGKCIMVQNWGASGNGDEVWAAPVGFGTASTFVFIEANTFMRANGTIGFENTAVDAYVGGKYVFRYNYVRNAFVLNHDKSGGGWTRAGQAFEIYDNEFNFVAGPGGGLFCAYFARDGASLYYNNLHSGSWQAYVKFWNRRMNESQGNWGACDGTKPWDGNAGPGGYPCADQVGRGQAAGLGSLNVQPQPLVPHRYWNNTGPVTAGCSGTSQLGGKVCNSSPSTIVLGVDFLFSDDNSAALPGYTPYPYPHPLAGGTRASP